MPSKENKKKRIIASSLIFISFIVSLGLMVYLSLEAVREKEQEKILYSLQRALNTSQEVHYIWLEHRSLELKRLSKVNTLISLLKQRQRKPSAELMQQLHTFVDTIFSLTLNKFENEHYWLISPSGVVLSSKNGDDINATHPVFLHSPELLELETNTFIPNLYQDLRLEHHDSMFLLQAIMDDGNKLGFIVSSVDPEINFSRITRLSRIGQTGETYAFDDKGILISESRFRKQMQYAGILSTGSTDFFKLRIADPLGNTIKGHQPTLSNSEQALTFMAKRATQGKNGYNLNGYRDYRGVTVVGIWVWNHKFSFGLASEMDKSEAYGNYYFLRNVIISSSICIAAIACAWFFLLWRRQNKAKWKLRKESLILEQKVKERTHALEDAKLNLENAYIELERISETDGLTGIANRRRADLKLREEWRRAQRNTYPITIMMIDVDFFKLYNDNYGHIAGDKCLRKIATALDQAAVCRRPGDLLARYGGEEFIVMLCNSDYDYAQLTAEKLRLAVLEQQVPHEYSLVADTPFISISLGVAIIKEPGLELEQMIELADQALYKSKHDGRNRSSFSQK